MLIRVSALNCVITTQSGFNIDISNMEPTTQNGNLDFIELFSPLVGDPY
jgi:hypothetical protein